MARDDSRWLEAAALLGMVIDACEAHDIERANADLCDVLGIVFPDWKPLGFMLWDDGHWASVLWLDEQTRQIWEAHARHTQSAYECLLLTQYFLGGLGRGTVSAKPKNAPLANLGQAQRLLRCDSPFSFPVGTILAARPRLEVQWEIVEVGVEETEGRPYLPRVTYRVRELATGKEELITDPDKIAPDRRWRVIRLPACNGFPSVELGGEEWLYEDASSKLWRLLGEGHEITSEIG